MTLGDAFEAAVAAAVRKAVREALAEVKPSPTSPDDLLSISSAAKLAEVSTATMRRWVSRGVLRRHGKGRIVRVRRADVLALTPDDKAHRSDESVVAHLLGRK